MSRSGGLRGMVSVTFSNKLEIELRASRLFGLAEFTHDALEGVAGSGWLTHVQVGLPEGHQQLGLATGAGVAANRTLDAHGGSLRVVAIQVEPRHIDLVIDQPLEGLAAKRLRLLDIR